MDRVVLDALDDMETGRWDDVRARLHPYLHWKACDGHLLRGRKKVMAYLRDGPTPSPPSAYELRDGQIYRWTE